MWGTAALVGSWKSQFGILLWEIALFVLPGVSGFVQKTVQVFPPRAAKGINKDRWSTTDDSGGQQGQESSLGQCQNVLYPLVN